MGDFRLSEPSIYGTEDEPVRFARSVNPGETPAGDFFLDEYWLVAQSEGLPPEEGFERAIQRTRDKFGTCEQCGKIKQSGCGHD